jgi:hypothetical protein
MTGSDANICHPTAGSDRQSHPPNVPCVTCCPAPKQSKTVQPLKPRSVRCSWISQRKSGRRLGQAVPAGLSMAKSDDLANAGATQQSPAQREQSAVSSSGMTPPTLPGRPKPARRNRL